MIFAVCKKRGAMRKMVSEQNLMRKYCLLRSIRLALNGRNINNEFIVVGLIGGIMSTETLLQIEADALLRMDKVRVNDDWWQFPDLGGRVEIPLLSRDHREEFSLDISRRQIALTTKYQARARQAIVLARLDFNSPHRNPDDSEVGIPHLHLYREGFGDRWAYLVPDGMLSNPSDAWQVLVDFMQYCKIVETPNIVRGLFS